MRAVWPPAIAAFGAIVASTLATQADDRPAKGIQDNSFLIEEAYNQEAGVVQHISTLLKQGDTWSYAFTQEWPALSQSHQLSYTIPYEWLDAEAGGVDGVGDVLLNYRWQALFETRSSPAFAPRLSLILPTGELDKGTGSDSIGYQINLPVSKIVSDHITLHGNAGLTSYADVEGQSPTSFNLGASAIYAISRDFNVLCEALGEWTEEVNDAGDIDAERSFTISPGLRYAINVADAQIVFGLAAPVTFSQNNSDYALFLYASFEHPYGG